VDQCVFMRTALSNGSEARLAIVIVKSGGILVGSRQR
jgi:hypothetical protein